jgi:hypothetical protein
MDALSRVGEAVGMGIGTDFEMPVAVAVAGTMVLGRSGRMAGESSQTPRMGEKAEVGVGSATGMATGAGVTIEVDAAGGGGAIEVGATGGGGTSGPKRSIPSHRCHKPPAGNRSNQPK